VVTDAGDGWGECVASHEPAYSSEFVDGSALVIGDHLWPTVVAAGVSAAAGVAPALARLKGHQMSKAALEMAVLDAELRADGISWKERIGSTRDRIPSGVSVGIFDTLDELSRQVAGYIADGYVRIKLKIEPGWDIEPVRMIRDQIGPDVPLQVDANTAYTRDDIAHLCKLDEFDLLLIEQPLPEEDILGHAELARASATPICLDESVVSMQTAVDAIELGAAEIVNIKPGRVGGYLAAVRIHDLCVDRGVPVWCGGMVETGIGRAANAGLASLPGFTLPGDISASTRFYARDVVLRPITVEHGHVTVPTTPGLGFELDYDFLDSITTSTVVLQP
jgi:O-succinylbenzoate synthase